MSAPAEARRPDGVDGGLCAGPTGCADGGRQADGPTVGSEDEVAGVIDDYNDPTSELAQSDWAKEFSTSQIPIVTADGPVGDGAQDKAAAGS